MRYLLLCAVCSYFILRLTSPAVHRAGWYHIQQFTIGCDASSENPIHVFQAGMESLRDVFRYPLLVHITQGEDVRFACNKVGTIHVVWDVDEERVYVAQLRRRRGGAWYWREKFSWRYPLVAGTPEENLAQFEGFARKLVSHFPKSRLYAGTRRIMGDVRLYVDSHEGSLWEDDSKARNAAVLGAFGLMVVSIWYWGWVASVYAQLRTEFPRPRTVPLSFWRCALAVSPEVYEHSYRRRARNLALEARKRALRADLEDAARQRQAARQAARARPRPQPVPVSTADRPPIAVVPAPKIHAPYLRNTSNQVPVVEADKVLHLRAPSTLSEWTDHFLALCEENNVEWPPEINPQLLATIIVVGLVRPSKRGICVGERYRPEREVFKDVKNKLGVDFSSNDYHEHVAWLVNSRILLEHKNAATVSLDQRSSKSKLGTSLQAAWERLAFLAAKSL